DKEYESVIAFLQDISGNYMAVANCDKKEQIVSLVPEEGVVVMHGNVDAFWETIVKFYTEKVYFLDEDGYLSSDFDLEGEIGAEINKDVDFWNE
ncbi:MAG: SMI1/KNR4 family protein, partial [Clostridia bacterium]|nr:SMI1/KNR4 family protein [Clostridia bacterium]